MIELKPFDLSNAETHFRWNNDEELNFYDSDYPHREESYDEFVNRMKLFTLNGDHGLKLFEIHDEDSGELIGVIDIYDIDNYNRRCHIDCTIGDKEFRNKGYGEAALQKALAVCFTDMGMNKVLTTAFDFNESWINLVQKLGFSKDGILRKHTWKQDGYCDKFLFSLLKEEFELDASNSYYKVSPT